MAKYQKYAEYKDSGVEWLGEIPDHWQVSKVKYLAPFQVGWTPPTKDDANFIGENLWVNISDLKGKTITSTSKQISDKAAQEASMDITPKGSLMYSFKLSVGAVSFAGCDMYTNEAIASFLDTSKLPLSFLYYVLPKFIIENASTNIYGAKILNQELIKNASLLELPFKEAQIIANFLDYETAKIDTLIANQEKLIELLKEKRQAVISHAVTKGLNPDVAMKDSGVEWLGQVPEHWVVAQLKFNTLEMQTGPFGSQLHAEDYIEDGIPLINPAHMINGVLVPDKQITVDEATQKRLSRHKLEVGDIIFARRGELGRCAIVREENKGWLCGTGSLKAKLNERLIPEYAYLLITSDGLIAELSLESKGSTMDNLNTETLGKVRTPVPPPDEQIAILHYVEQVSGKYENLIQKAESAIQLMQERRTALISAAVIGKIDVRNWQNPNNNNEAKMEFSA